MNLSTLSHITNNVLPKHTTNLTIGLCGIFKLQAGNLPLKLPECKLGNPPQNTTCNAPQNINCKESAAWMLVPVHFWQRTSNDGSRLATHLKIRIQCPEPAPNYDLAAGNAPETTKRTSNHIAGCPANMKLE